MVPTIPASLHRQTVYNTNYRVKVMTVRIDKIKSYAVVTPEDKAKQSRTGRTGDCPCR